MAETADEKLSAAQRGKIRRLSQPKELAPDEEGGELNIVPFLDIITNVLMFVLATVTSTFTRDDRHVPAEARWPRRGAPNDADARPDGHRRPGGLQREGGGRNIAPGCHDTGSGHHRAEDGRRTTTSRAQQCVERLKKRAREFGTRRSVTISANPNIPYQVDHQHDRRRPQDEEGEDLSPTCSFGLPR